VTQCKPSPVSSDTVQAFSDPEAEHELHVDVDATLTQRKLGQQEWQEEQASQRQRGGTARLDLKL